VLDEHVFVNRGATIGRHAHRGVQSRSTSGNVGGLSRFGRRHIGIGATLIRRLVVGDNAVIGAGSTVLDDVPETSWSSARLPGSRSRSPRPSSSRTVATSNEGGRPATPFDVGHRHGDDRPTDDRAGAAFGLRAALRQSHPGTDRHRSVAGERGILEQLIDERPANVAVTVLDLGYSTSQRNGGLYPSHFGGALKTILSYAANSRYVTYLDDDNWYAPDHLATLLAAVAGKDWAFALRHLVEARSGELLCPDTWESVGPDRGVYAQAQGGFVDTNCFLIDKLACHDVFPEWAMTRYAGGTGGDRQVLGRLRGRPWGTNGAHTLYYRQHLTGLHPYLLWRYRRAGVDLARYLPAAAMPSEAVWQQCAEFDRRQADNSAGSRGTS
jgi:hypothetical protein